MARTIELQQLDDGSWLAKLGPLRFTADTALGAISDARAFIARRTLRPSSRTGK